MAPDITIIMVADSHAHKQNGSCRPTWSSRLDSIVSVYDVQQCTTKIVYNFKYKADFQSIILESRLAQSTIVLSAKANYVSLIPRTHMLEEKNRLLQVFL